jgi:hypothetical protein
VVYGDSLEGTRGSLEGSEPTMEDPFMPISVEPEESVTEPPLMIEEFIGDEDVESSEEDDLVNSKGSVEYFDGKLFGISLLFITTLIMAVSAAKGSLRRKKGDI